MTWISVVVSCQMSQQHTSFRMSVWSSAQRVWQEESSSSELSLRWDAFLTRQALCPAGIRSQIRHGYTQSPQVWAFILPCESIFSLFSGFVKTQADVTMNSGGCKANQWFVMILIKPCLIGWHHSVANTGDIGPLCIATLSEILVQTSVCTTQKALLPLKISLCMVLISYILVYKIYSHIILSKNLHHYHSLPQRMQTTSGRLTSSHFDIFGIVL